MALDSFSYDIVEQAREFTQLANLYYLERITLELNTRGNDVTPVLQLEATEYSLDTVNTTARDLVEVEVNRIGPFSRLTFSPVLGIQWYQVAVYLRPLVLGVKVVERSLRTVFPGRSSNIGEYLLWDVNPFSLPNDARNQQIIMRYLFLDLVTGSEIVTPELIYNDGTTETLDDIIQTTRGVYECPILTSKRVRQVKLNGDFTNSNIVIYDVELDAYLPSMRRMAIG